MSRSHQKHPFCAMVCCNSQKKAKRHGNRAMRRTTKSLIEHFAEDEDLLLPIDMDEIMNVWSMPKDGINHWYSFAKYVHGRINNQNRRWCPPGIDYMEWYRMVMMK